MNKVLKLVVVMLIVVLLSYCNGCTRSSDQEKADLVVKNARIFTSNEDVPWAEAAAVKDQKFIYVGDNNGVEGFIDADTRVIDADGRMVVPGFIDNHCHLVWMGSMSALWLDVYDIPTYEEMADMVRTYAGENPDLPFIFVFGWRYDYIPGGLPTREMADEIIADKPLVLWSHSGHTGWFNTMAIEEFQNRNETAFNNLSPLYDEDTGEPTGALTQFTPFNIFEFYSREEIGEDSSQRMMQATAEILNFALYQGITTINDVQINSMFVAFLLEYKEQGLFDNIRFRGTRFIGPWTAENFEQLDEDLDDWIRTGLEHSQDHFILGDSVKLYIDGVFGNYTSFMLEPYTNQPDTVGYALWSQEDFDRVIEIIDSKNLQACTHATGDAGIRRVVNSYEKVRSKNRQWDARHRIEHVELPHPSEFSRIAESNIFLAFQFSHLFGIDNTGMAAIGEERMQQLMPWRDLKEIGANISCGSDWCAAPMNPLYGILIGSTRLTQLGTPITPEQALSTEEVIRAYTIESARSIKMEDRIGSIETGKYADFVLYSVDLTDINTWNLPEDGNFVGKLDDFVLLTVVNGRIVYQKEGTEF